MNKREILKNLIESSDLVLQLKINKIIQTLQLTEDPLKAKPLSEQVLVGSFNNLEEESIDNLIEAFNDGNVNDTLSYKNVEKNREYDTEDKGFINNKEQTLEYELRAAKEQMSQLEKTFNQQIQEEREKRQQIQEENNKLLSILVATKVFELVEIPDEDINELYIKYLQTGEVKHKEAFIMNDIIPKSYYRLNRSGGNEKC